MAGHSVSHYSEQIAALGQSIEWLKERLPQIADLVIILTLLAYLVKEFAVPRIRKSRLRHPVDLRITLHRKTDISSYTSHRTKTSIIPTFLYCHHSRIICFSMLYG